jgi:hypothetical protein
MYVIAISFRSSFNPKCVCVVRVCCVLKLMLLSSPILCIGGLCHTPALTNVKGHPIYGANQTARFVPREDRLYADKGSFLVRFFIKRPLFV